MTNIYEMKLHTRLRISERLDVMRVPGGWIYTRLESTGRMTSVFVPYNSEFQWSEDGNN